jgi:hypothetical protein
LSIQGSTGPRLSSKVLRFKSVELIVADVVLLTYPLEYPQQQPLKNLDFYALHTSPNGPAMTYSNFAIDAAQISVQGCATWSYLLAGSAPYVAPS